MEPEGFLTAWMFLGLAIFIIAFILMSVLLPFFVFGIYNQVKKINTDVEVMNYNISVIAKAIIGQKRRSV